MPVVFTVNVAVVDPIVLVRVASLEYSVPSLLVFVYEKTDNHRRRTGRLDIQHAIFVNQDRTADFQMTRGLRQILENEGNADDVIAFIQDRNLPVDDIEANSIVY